MPIRVLYIHGFQRIGGAERALLGLADAIRQMAVEPVVLWPRKDRTFTWLQSRGIHVCPLKVPLWRNGLSLPLVPLFLGRLKRNVSLATVDLVHVNNYRSAPFGRFVSRWARVPCVCHVRELIGLEKIRQYRLHTAEALIAVADAVGHALIEGGIPQDRVVTVRSGIASHGVPSREMSLSVRGDLGIPPRDPVLGIVAHILPHKGFDDLVRALALVKETWPNIRCLVVGEAPRKRYLQHLLDLAERLRVRDRLTLVGFREDVPRLLHAMDIFVLPSHTEGFPITILEAMAAGIPVVATTVGGIPEAIQDGATGLLVPPRDPRQLAAAIIGLLEAPEIGRGVGEKGRKQVERLFTLEGEAKQTSMVYQKVLAASSQDSAHVRHVD